MAPIRGSLASCISKDHSKVLAGIYHFKGVAMKLVICLASRLLFDGDSQHDTFYWVESHLPSFFPEFQCLKVSLKQLPVIVVLNHLEELAIIGKQLGVSGQN